MCAELRASPAQLSIHETFQSAAPRSHGTGPLHPGWLAYLFEEHQHHKEHAEGAHFARVPVVVIMFPQLTRLQLLVRGGVTASLR